MDETTRLVVAIIVPTFAVLVGILLNNRQIDGLRSEMNARFDSLGLEITSVRSEMNARFEASHQALLRVGRRPRCSA